MKTQTQANRTNQPASRLRKFLKITGIVLGGLVGLIAILAVLIIVSDNGRLVLPVKHLDRFEASRYPLPVGMAEPSGPLQIKGNQILDPQGVPVLLQGLMPPDPARLDARGKFKREFYVGIRESGANVIRIAVHPDRWLQDEDYLWRHIDPIVGWAGQMGMVAIIDWHYIGNIETGAGAEMPDIEANPAELTLDFWNQMAAYFRTAPHVIFEIWNEPAGGISAGTWQSYAAQIVGAIRAQGAKQPVIVGGIDYGRDLSWVLDNPIPDENVIYTAHIYPGHSRQGWDLWFGKVSEKYPVLVTEWGFMDENRAEAPDYLAGTAANYGEPFLAYLEEHGIGWVACWYDDDWKPPMFSEKWKIVTNYGAFVFERLNGDRP